MGRAFLPVSRTGWVSLLPVGTRNWLRHPPLAGQAGHFFCKILHENLPLVDKKIFSRKHEILLGQYSSLRISE